MQIKSRFFIIKEIEMKYKVIAGDTLSAIALRARTTVQQILVLNPALRANPNQLSVGEDIALPPQDIQQPGLLPTTPGELGALSEAYETGGRGCVTVSGGNGDAGGVSYGSYQMTSANGGGTVTKFVHSPEFPWANAFVGLIAGSPEFTKKWIEIAKNNPDAFKKAENFFIKRTLFDPLCNKIVREDGVNIMDYSPVLQDVIWSTAVQHGGATNIVHMAFASMRAAGNFNPQAPCFEVDAIKAIYAERGRKNASGTLVNFSRNSPAVQAGVARRFEAECQEAISRIQHAG